MSERTIAWVELVSLAAQPPPAMFRAEGRSVLGSGRYRERDAFTVVRAGLRWRIDQQLDPVRVVGDATRDLVSDGGGLRRMPAPQGWSGLPATHLLRPELEAMDDLSIFTLLGAPRSDEVAGRACWQVELAYGGKDPFTLCIDAELGVRLSQTSVEGAISLDLFDPAARIADSAFAVLEHSPDVDLEAEVPTPPVLQHTVEQVSALSPPGIDVAVRSFDDLADSYTLVLRRNGTVVAFLDRRSDEHAASYEPLLPGRQERWGWEPWEYSFDAREDGSATRQWADRLLRQFVMVTPRMDDPIE